MLTQAAPSPATRTLVGARVDLDPGAEAAARSARLAIMAVVAKVYRLPEILARQIAAGEVIERPASVVKELVENSLDAESRRIKVEILQGGKRSITVTDDGTGMSPADARLAFEHHATSKIRRWEDLTRIRSLGFRGEALPSIASVSRLRLRTVESGATRAQPPPGTEILYSGGKCGSEREISWPQGTEVRVEDLFFNVPARQKFLKTPTTEIGHISRQLMHYALAYPEVEFGLRHQNRRLLEAAAVSDLQERVYQVLGESFLPNLVPVQSEREGVGVHGLAALPHEQRNHPTHQFLYVNRRVVKDRVLLHAVRQAYRDVIPSSAYPVLLLFVEIDPQEVDVNVHPGKIEVRFQDSRRVHSAVFHAIEEALLLHGSRPERVAHGLSLDQLQSEMPLAAVTPRSAPGSTWRSFSGNSTGMFDMAVARREAPLTASLATDTAHLDAIPETDRCSPVPVVMGQFVESFIVAADREGVMLVDQHVAHERILYDRALQALEQPSRMPSQRLLSPEILELNVGQRSGLEEILAELNENGFEVDWFGEGSLAIKALPAEASDCDARSLVQEILSPGPHETVGNGNGGAQRLRLRQRIAISLSCRQAIKVNTVLSPQKMQWLLDELFDCANPYTCPHGRPIVLRLGIEQILRGFKRIS